MPAYTEV